MQQHFAETQPHSFTPIYIVNETILLGRWSLYTQGELENSIAGGGSEMGKTT